MIRRIVAVEQREVDRDALLHTGIGKMRPTTPLRLAAIGELPIEGRAGCIGRACSECAPGAGRACAPDVIAAGSNRAWIACPRDRRRPAEACLPVARTAILCESIRSFFAFPPWMAFMASAWPSTNVMPSATQTSASQYQVNMHSAATTSSVRYGATISRNAAGVDATLRCTSTWPAPSRIQTYMVFTWRSIPQ